MKELWLCGQLIGKWSKTGSVWAFQGIFTTKQKAINACRTSKYFIYPVQLDEELPVESVMPERYEYPLAHK